MMYNQHTPDPLEPGSEATPEEEFVREALADYVQVKDYRVWCPIMDLYRTYRGKWMARGTPYPGEDDPRFLSVQQFGAVLNAVFPASIPVTRRVAGAKTRGRACLDGPAARHLKRAGRPRKEQ